MSSPVLEVLGNKHCATCPLSKSSEHLSVRNQTVMMNARYFPKAAIKLLFVAESPPMAFAKNGTSYFYAPKKMTGSRLAYHTMCALFEKQFPTKEQFLEEFSKENYLVDMVKCPINKLENDDKRDALLSCAKYLNEELHALNFEKALFVGKGSYSVINSRLDLQNLNYEVIPLPYHSKRNIEEFKRRLAQASKNIPSLKT
jgi:hypothetical protein